MRISVISFGCKLNQCESESIASAFRDAGFRVVPPGAPADLYIVNTCTVTSKGEQKARRIIRKLHSDNPAAFLLVTGCYAQMEASSITALGSRVMALSMDSKARILDLPLNILQQDRPLSLSSLQSVLQSALGTGCAVSDSEPPSRFRFHSPRLNYHSRAFLKIQDGCDNACTYCRVTLARGPSVSLDADLVVQRAQEIVQTGQSELVLTGVNISQYRSRGKGLAGLLEALLQQVPGPRIRLSSLEPDSIDEDLAGVLHHPRVCPHFHIPVQSGSDSILKRMGRHYNADQLHKAASLLRKAQPNPFLAADIIVGFPGETESDFRQTCTLMEQLSFSRLHVFPFSPRPGTAARHLSGRVPSAELKQRAAGLRRLSETLHTQYKKSCLFREEMLILESLSSDQRWQGTSGNYLKLPVTDLPPHASPGDLLPVCIIESQGEFIAKVRN